MLESNYTAKCIGVTDSCFKTENSYRTPQVEEVSIAIISAAAMDEPGLNSEPQNIEY